MILHLDMDAFFAAIEQLDNPELRGRPVVVGGQSDRSVVCTASYEARPFGIHSAMPVFQARRKCSSLVVVPVRHKRYSQVSAGVMAILYKFSPLVEQVSIDEAYMDISGTTRLFGNHSTLAQTLKEKIKSQLGLTCSIGIAPLKFLAKIASDMNKPDGITIVPREKALDFARNLDICKIPGVGGTTLGRLQTMQIRKLGDIRRYDPKILNIKFGKFGQRLMELANGIDPCVVETSHHRKSISKEITLSHDTCDLEFIRLTLLSLSHQVGAILRQQNKVAQTIVIKLKFSDFKQITRSLTPDSPVCSSLAIFKSAFSLFKACRIQQKIRLIGVGVSSIRDNSMPVQMEMFSSKNELNQKWENVDMAIDSICRKFGPNLVKKAALTNLAKEDT